MTKLYLLFFLTLFSFPSLSCKLPKGEVIKVGCTYNCDFFYRFRLKMTAWGMGYNTSITTLHDKPDMKEALSSVDAVLLPGGADIDPKYYVEKVSPELKDYTLNNLHLVNFSREGRKRDPFEYAVVRSYLEDETYKNLPMLGICRGLQMMSVAQGIPLYLDIKTELGIKNRMHRFDRISLINDKETLMKELYQRKSFKAYKLHHQGIRISYFEQNQSQFPQTKITAYSNNRLIAEAIELTHRPALGVQYHPERSFSGASVPVFRWFLNKACEYKNIRKEVK